MWLTTSLPWWLGSCRVVSACPQHHQESDCEDTRAAAAVMAAAGSGPQKSTVEVHEHRNTDSVKTLLCCTVRRTRPGRVACAALELLDLQALDAPHTHFYSPTERTNAVRAPRFPPSSHTCRRAVRLPSWACVPAPAWHTHSSLGPAHAEQRPRWGTQSHHLKGRRAGRQVRQHDTCRRWEDGNEDR